jgi:hypothetical protein
MRVKMQRWSRRLAVQNAQGAVVELPLEFEGKRAFVIWDRITLGKHEFQARIEINRRLLQKTSGSSHQYLYRGQLILPRPQDN